MGNNSSKLPSCEQKLLMRNNAYKPASFRTSKLIKNSDSRLGTQRNSQEIKNEDNERTRNVAINSADLYDSMSFNSDTLSYRMSNSTNNNASNMMSEDLDYLIDTNACSSFINSNEVYSNREIKEMGDSEEIQLKEAKEEDKIETKNDGEKLRQSYMYRLMNSQMSSKTFQFQNLFIATWDDTLFATSYLAPYFRNQIAADLIDCEIKTKIERLEKTLVKLLSTALQQGADVYIISEANKGWIEESIKLYLPRVRKIIDNYSFSKLSLIYTQDYISYSEEDDSTDQRLEAINSIFNRYIDYFNSSIFNITCLTDSMTIIENVGKIVKENIAEARDSTIEQSVFVKTLKLKETPEIDDIIKQQQLVIDQFKTIYGATRNLNIKVKISSKK